MSVRDKQNAFNRNMAWFTTTRQSRNGENALEYTRPGRLVLLGGRDLIGMRAAMLAHILNLVAKMMASVFDLSAQSDCVAWGDDQC